MSQLFEGFSRATIRQSSRTLFRWTWFLLNWFHLRPRKRRKCWAMRCRQATGVRGTVEIKKVFETDKTRTVMVQPPPTSRLVAWSDPNSLGAEKFRALAVRLDAHAQATRAEISASDQ